MTGESTGGAVALAGTSEVGRHPDRPMKIVALVAALALIGFIIVVVVREDRKPAANSSALAVAPPPVLGSGAQAPTFDLPRLGGGSPVSLAEFRGKPLIINFFASWCHDCRSELGAVASVARQQLGRVAVIGIDSNETSLPMASQLLASAGATYPVGVDAHAQVATRYLLSALPVTYAISADGKVVGAVLGPQTVASLDRLATRLAGRS